MMVWPWQWQEIVAACIYFGCGGSYRFVPRPSLFVLLLSVPLSILAVSAYALLGPEAGSIWCWAASSVCAAFLIEPALIDSLGALDRDMVNAEDLSLQATEVRDRMRQRPLAYSAFVLMWAHAGSLGPAGDRRPWRPQSTDS
mmetsp:Transcript_8863/g.23148  ORF Transcript_8863/g.23148 Transcript_8863/m.23148 type:complete len:142 (+) Transcript_8863:3-428(+)